MTLGEYVGDNRINYEIIVPIFVMGDVSAKIIELGGVLLGMTDERKGHKKIEALFEKRQKIEFVKWYEKSGFGLRDLGVCSFCGKRRTEVGTLINGPVKDLFICNECVQESVRIIESE